MDLALMAQTLLRGSGRLWWISEGNLRWLCEIIFRQLNWDLWLELHWLHGWERWVQMHSEKFKHKGSHSKGQKRCLFWMSYVQPRAKVKYILLGFLFQVLKIQEASYTSDWESRTKAKNHISGLLSLIQYLTWVFKYHYLSMFIPLYVKYSF